MEKEPISKALRAIIPRLDEIPLPDTLTTRLLAAIGEGCSAEELKDIIEAEPNVTLQVLKVSNSAYYGQRSRIQNIERAILLMGIEEIRNICLSICLIDKFNPKKKYAKHFDIQDFWLHSLLTAIIASRLAKDKKWLTPEDAFVLGLLHDIGKTVFAVALPDVFDKLAGLAGTHSGTLFHEIEIKAGLSHTLIGSWIATRWGLPPIIASSIEFHHEPEEVIDEFAGHVAIINLSDTTAMNLMYFSGSGKYKEEFPSTWSLDKLNMLSEDYPEFLRASESALAEAESMLAILQK